MKLSLDYIKKIEYIVNKKKIKFLMLQYLFY